VTKLKFPFIAAGMLVTLVALAVSPARSGLLSLVSSSGAEQTTFRIAGDAIGSVYPGGSSVPIDLAVTNTGSSAITVTSVAVKIGGTSNAGCDTSNFSIASQLAASVSVPAGSTVSLSQAGVPSIQWPQIAMLDTAANQDACRGAAIDLAYTGTATSAGSPVPPPPPLPSVSHGLVYVNGQWLTNGAIPYGATVLIESGGDLRMRAYRGAITVKPPPGHSIQFTVASAFVTLPYRTCARARQAQAPGIRGAVHDRRRLLALRRRKARQGASDRGAQHVAERPRALPDRGPVRQGDRQQRDVAGAGPLRRDARDGLQRQRSRL